MWLLYSLVGIVVLLLVIILSLWAVNRRRSKIATPSTVSSSKGWSEYIRIDSNTLVTVGVYLFVVYMVRAMLPSAWNWMWSNDVFWIIQGAVICTALIFFMAPRWSRYVLLPVIIAILVIFIAEDFKSGIGYRPQPSEERIIEPAPTEAEIRGFLSNPAPPPELQVKKDRGEIWDLEILFAGTVTRDRWSEVIELPVPPRGRYYRFETEILRGQVEVMNRGEYQGRFPDPRLKIFSRRPLRLQYRSADLPKTAVVVWRWTQGRLR